jgi:dethiobiotin synthetase
VLSIGLIRWARNHGLKAVGVKPVETGCSLKAGMLDPEDGALLQKASQGDISLDECCPYRFSLPAAPFRAATMEGSRIHVPELEEHVRTVVANADLTVVEGAGGLMVPVSESTLMIDLIESLSYPVLVCAKTTLGTVNHTLLSVEALRSREISILGIVLSPSSDSPGPEEEFTPRDIARLLDDVPVVILPRFDQDQLKDPAVIAQSMESSWPQSLMEKWVNLSGYQD